MKVCIVGGGAAGMMAASIISKKGHDVSIFEKNEKLGKKIYITGKGRCNVTNATTGADFSKNIVNGKKFMMGALSRFDSSDTINFFEENGVPLKTERGNRVFPVSDKSSDIIKGLEKAMKKAGVNVFLNCEATKILLKADNAFVVFAGGEEYNFDAVIIATGGLSYSSTGSTGDGYKFAKSFGHNIIETVPSLCGIVLKSNELCCLQGLSLKNVKLSAKLDGKVCYESEIGEMLFTQSGISGPLALSASSFINRLDFERLKLFVDFKPAVSLDELVSRIDREIASLGAKQTSSLFEEFLPRSLVSIFLERLKLGREFKANQLSKEKRKEFALLLKNFELVPLRLEGFLQAVVTSGGVDTKEINPKTMQSKKTNNLYFIGEVLDIDALTGGFNLQLAFSTAAACGEGFETIF